MQINKICRHKSPQAGEAGFTLIEMIMVIVIASILGTFIFQVLTKSLTAQITMQKRKERSDDATLSMDRVNRELKEAKDIVSAGSNELKFEKNVTSSTDTNKFIKYVRDIPTNSLMRQSAATLGALPGNSTSGSVIARNVSYFNSVNTSGRVFLELKFADGSHWRTNTFQRNNGL